MKTWMITLTLTIPATLAMAGDGHKGHGHHGYGHYGHAPVVYPATYGYQHANYGYPQHHYAGTYRGSVLRGAAAVIRAQGQYNLNTAIAANHIQNARSLALDVDLKRAQTYFAKKEINKAARQTSSTEQAVARRERIANSARPNRLGPTQYRADLGLLNWPAMLRRPEFETLRKAVDAKVAVGISAMKLHGSEIYQLSSEMREDMKPLLRQRLVSSNDYAIAARFLKSLQYESQVGARGQSLASIGN